MARYEFSDGKSNKFWEITQDDTVLTIVFGRIGTAGTLSTKVLPSAYSAKAEHDKLVAEKKKKGYKLATAEQAQSASKRTGSGGGPSVEELEAGIIASPDDEPAWRQYGEALKSAGDPRGEAVLLSIGSPPSKPPEAVTKLATAHRKKWLGNLAQEGCTAKLEFTHGAFIDTARISASYEDEEGQSPDAQTRSLLRLESAKFLRALTIGLADAEGDNDYAAVVTAIIKAGKRPSLRKLVIGDFEYPDESEISWATIGDVGRILPLMSNLEEMRVQGGKIIIKTASHPTLRSLILHTGGLPGITARGVASSKLPELLRLEMWLGTESYGGSADIGALTPLFDGKGFPNLKELGLMNSTFQNAIAKGIVGSKILKQLDVLDLSMGTMNDEGGEAILAAKAKLAHLSKLNLENNYLSEKLAKKIKAALPNAQVGRQRTADMYGDEAHYYTAVGE